MKPKILTVLVCAALYQTTLYAKVPSYCAVNKPPLSSQTSEIDTSTDAPVYIEADKLNAIYPTKGTFSGDVIIEQGRRKLLADTAEIEQTVEENNNITKRTVTADGNVTYSDAQISLSTSKLSADLNSEKYETAESTYHFVDRLGRGNAEKIITKQNRDATITQGSFTACPEGDNSWMIQGSTINYSEEKEQAEIWNAIFKVGSVPVFYLPYFQYPTTNTRRSGLLLPTAKYSKTDGFEYIQPYYWNIAPNFDATLSTHYISKRGLRFNSEFRYLLNNKNSGLFAFDWLPDDNVYKYSKFRTEDNHNRWLFYWRQDTRFDNGLRFNANYTKVSDRRFFADLDSVYGSSTDGYATQNMSASYIDDHWNTKLSTERFQIFDSNVTNVYQSQPKLEINYNLNNQSPTNFENYLQIAHFKNLRHDKPTTTRIHIEPTLTHTFVGKLGSVENILGLMATHYQQNIPGNYIGRELDRTVNRILPFMTIDAKMALEREVKSLSGYTQTLEPRIQYRYVAYKDQSNIQNFDSVMLQSDYAGLFRNKTYSGYDRIASANQVATGLTTRMYDETLTERFNASIGQVYHIKKSRTGDALSPIDKNQSQGSTTWAFDSFWHMNNFFNLSTSLQYDIRINAVALSDILFEYRQNSEQLLQLNYRYANKDYISALDLNINTPYKKNISQLGAIGSWPLNERVVVIGAFYYDMNQQQSSDSFIGLQYSSCCWGIDVTYGRKIVGWDRFSNTSVYDNKLSFNITLQGLGSNTSNVRKILNSGIHPYQHIF